MTESWHATKHFFDLVLPDHSDAGARLLLSDILLARLAESGTLRTIVRIATLPYVAGPVVVYPDASPKSFGFPNGLALRTTPDWVYPLAAPDMGCGFEVVDTGIDLEQSGSEHSKASMILQSIETEVGSRSHGRGIIASPVRAILEAGLSAIGDPDHFARLPDAEEGNSWPAAVKELAASEIDELQLALGAATGHFIAVLVVEHATGAIDLPPGRVIIIVHTGAAPIREILNRRGYYYALASWSADSGYSDPQDASEGFFAVPTDSPKGRNFLELAMACRNFGYANRQIVADKVLEVVMRYWGANQVRPAREVRHVDHVAFEVDGDCVLARRGLQPAHPRLPSFIAGGGFSHAYLVSTSLERGLHGGLLPHGNPVLPAVTSNPRGAERGNRRGKASIPVVATNVPLDEIQRAADITSIEDLLTYTDGLGWTRREASLNLLVNYRDLER